MPFHVRVSTIAQNHNTFKSSNITSTDVSPLYQRPYKPVFHIILVLWRFYRSSTALDAPAVQFTFSSTRVRSWTPLRPHECVMSKEECSYNKALYCSSAFASVHHTDDYVWTLSEEPQWVRALAPRFWTFNVL